MAGEDKQYGQEYKVKKWSNEVKEQRYINKDATEAFCMWRWMTKMEAHMANDTKGKDIQYGQGYKEKKMVKRN